MNKYILTVFILLTVILCGCESTEQDNTSPISQFSFETSLEDTNKEHTLIPYGEMSFNVCGISGGSIALDGGYLQLGNSNELTLKDQFTYSVWININDFISYNPILFGNESSSGDISGGPLSIYFNENYSALQCDLTFVTNDTQYKSHSFIAQSVTTMENLKQQWTHIVVTLNKDVVKMYIDGAKVYDQALPEDFGSYKEIATNSKPYTIGRSVYRNFDASLDEIKIYAVALSEDKIKSIYDSKIASYTNLLTLKKDSNEIKINKTSFQLSAPINVDSISGDILIPLKAFCDSMGASLSWDGSDGLGRLDISYNNHNASFWVLNSNASFDGKHTKISPTPQTINEIAYVPLTAFVESIGGIIKYSSQEDTYKIYY